MTVADASERYPFDDHPLQDAAQVTWADRNASLDALHALEDALAEPTTGRERQWLDEVLATLDGLAGALDAQASGDAESASLLSEIAAEEPRLLPRVERLRREYDDVRQSIISLRDQLAPEAGFDADVGDVRDRLASVARRLRAQRAREADLVYEAVNINLGAGD